MSKKRNKLEVIRDILKTISNGRDGIKPTHILYKSNLSHHMMDDYLKDLIKKNFIFKKKDSKGSRYFLNKRGKDYLEQYKLITNFTDSFGLN